MTDLHTEEIPTGWRAFYDPEGLTGFGPSREGALSDLADKLEEMVGIGYNLYRDALRQAKEAHDDLADVTRERDAMDMALGSLGELLAKQIAVPRSTGALACAACGWPNDKHPDDCPVDRGLKIIERALAPKKPDEQLTGLIPDGWKLVPTEPTNAMWDQAENAMVMADMQETEGDDMPGMFDFPTKRIWLFVLGYRAAMNAAPTPHSSLPVEEK